MKQVRVEISVNLFVFFVVWYECVFDWCDIEN